MQLAASNNKSISDAARRQLYMDINCAQEEEDCGVAAIFDKHKSVILPVLIKGKRVPDSRAREPEASV